MEAKDLCQDDDGTVRIVATGQVVPDPMVRLAEEIIASTNAAADANDKKFVKKGGVYGVDGEEVVRGGQAVGKTFDDGPKPLLRHECKDKLVEELSSLEDTVFDEMERDATSGSDGLIEHIKTKLDELKSWRDMMFRNFNADCSNASKWYYELEAAKKEIKEREGRLEAYEAWLKKSEEKVHYLTKELHIAEAARDQSYNETAREHTEATRLSIALKQTNEILEMNRKELDRVKRENAEYVSSSVNRAKAVRILTEERGRQNAAYDTVVNKFSTYEFVSEQKVDSLTKQLADVGLRLEAAESWLKNAEAKAKILAEDKHTLAAKITRMIETEKTLRETIKSLDGSNEAIRDTRDELKKVVERQKNIIYDLQKILGNPFRVIYHWINPY